MSYKVRDRSADLKEVERGVENAFRWNWLEEKDKLGDFLSEWVRNIDQPGVAVCAWCNDRVKYGGKGKSHLKKHAA
jgi:hypothetical protein